MKTILNCQKIQVRPAIMLSLIIAAFAIIAPALRAAGNHLDYSFSGDGKLTTNFSGTSNDYANAVAVQTNGKIVVAGSSKTVNGDEDIAVTRYTSTGSLDTTFGNGGRVTTNFFGGDDAAASIVIQPNGKIIVAGTAYNNGKSNFAIVRYNSDGSLDTSFSGNGKFYLNFSGHDDSAQSVTLQSDGKILVAGKLDYSSSSSFYWGVARIYPGGALDSSFGTGGKVTSNFTGPAIASSVVVQPSGRILVGGWVKTSAGANANFAIQGFQTNGATDLSFGTGGAVQVNLGGSSFGVKLKLMSDGRIVFAGDALFDNAHHFAVARFTVNGALDPTFSGDGKALGPVGEGLDVVVTSGDDNIIVAGFNGNFSLVYFKYDGSLNPQFGTGGVVNTFFGDFGLATSIALQSGKIIAAGQASSASTGYDFAVARYKESGIAVNSDFMNFGFANYAVFRPSTGVWYELRNTGTGASATVAWGSPGDISVPGDYDGDGLTDHAVFRASNSTWYIKPSSGSANVTTQFGLAGDKPVQGDYDGDGKTDIAVFRPSNATWYLQRTTLGSATVQFGLSTDNPVPADYDGDGLCDVAAFRPSNSTWYLNRSLKGYTSMNFGVTGDRAIPADFDGDGKADLSVWRPSTGVWYIFSSKTNSASAFNWGLSGDIPAPADFDGDGKADYAMWRPSNGIWYVYQSASAASTEVAWGLNGDVPIAAAYVP